MPNELLEDNILKNLEKLHFKVKRKFLGRHQGTHASFKKGQGVEFSDFCTYSLGDNPKNIDWNIYAKTEKLYIKEFKEYENMNFFIYLDASNSMSVNEENLYKNTSKFDKAKKITAALSYIALINNEDLTIASSNNLISNRISNKKNFSKVLYALNSIETSNDDFFGDNLSLYLSKIKFPGVAVCISDFLTPFERIKQGLDKIRNKNLDIFLIQINDKHFISSYENKNAKFIDSETKEERVLNLNQNILSQYMQKFNKHLELIKTYSQKYNIKFHTLNLDDDLLTFLNKTSLCY